MVYYLPTSKITIKGDYPSAGDQRGGSGGQPNPKPTETGSPTNPPDKPPEGNAATVSGGPLALTVAASVEADRPAGIYYVTPKTNDIFDDEVQVTINTKHLLSAGKVTSEDKTAEILGTIASLAATAHGGLLSLAVTEKPQPFCFSFDPSSYDGVKLVQGQLKRRHIGLTVNVDGRNVIAEDIPVLPNDEVKRTAATLGQNGLVFRPAAVYTLRLVYPLDSNDNAPNPEKSEVFILDTEQFILPDRTKLCVMKFDRMAFVKKIREVGFTDGMLTDSIRNGPARFLDFWEFQRRSLRRSCLSPALDRVGADQPLAQPVGISIFKQREFWSVSMRPGCLKFLRFIKVGPVSVPHLVSGLRTTRRNFISLPKLMCDDATEQDAPERTSAMPSGQFRLVELRNLRDSSGY
jgi:hypothetical protein